MFIISSVMIFISYYMLTCVQQYRDGEIPPDSFNNMVSKMSRTGYIHMMYDCTCIQASFLETAFPLFSIHGADL